MNKQLCIFDLITMIDCYEKVLLVVINSLVNWLGCLKTCFRLKARFFWIYSNIINNNNVYNIISLPKQIIQICLLRKTVVRLPGSSLLNDI